MTEQLDTTRKRILVIEDDARYLDLIRLRLEAGGYAVLAAFDGETGLERAREEPFPDAVLVDVLLPKRDGFEVCMVLKADPRTSHIPIAMMSAIYTEASDRERAMDTGATKYFVKPDVVLDKPLRFDELLAELHRILGGSSSTSVSPDGQDVVLLVDDDPKNLRLMRLTLTSERRLVLQASHAEGALETLAARGHVDLVITDIQMPGTSGLELLEELRCRHPDLPVVMMTAFGSEQIAVDAMKLGAVDYLTKPIVIRELPSRIDKILEHARLSAERQRLHRQLKETSRELLQRVDRLQAKNHEVSQALAKLEHARKSQEEFVATLSHELRAPLTTLKGSMYLAMLPDEEMPRAQRQEMLERGNKSVDRLVAMVNQLLDLQTIEARGLSLEPADVDLEHLVLECCREAEPRAARSGIRIVQRLTEERSMCRVDEDAVRRVLINLLDNAIKYSPESGEILVGLDLHPDSTRIWVADRGPGIPAEERERVFDRFVRLSDQGSSRPIGSGLGLAIARSLVELHSGTIGVDERPAGGSLFWFELPSRCEAEELAIDYAGRVASIGLNGELAIGFAMQARNSERHYVAYKSPEEYLTNPTGRGDLVILDLASAPTLHLLFSVLRELELHQARRALILPPQGASIDPEIGRLFEFATLLDHRPDSSELVHLLDAHD